MNSIIDQFCVQSSHIYKLSVKSAIDARRPHSHTRKRSLDMSCATATATTCCSRRTTFAHHASARRVATQRRRQYLAPTRVFEDDLLTPLLDAPDGVSVALPVLAALVAIGGTRTALYASLQYATAGFLGRQIARESVVVELGVDTKNLYYYPKSTKMVIGVDPDVNAELVNRMSIETQIPVLPRATVIAGTAEAEMFWGQSAASVDAVVTTGCLAKLSDEEVKTVAKKAARVLKPGGRFIFVEPALGDRGQKLFDAIESTMTFDEPIQFDGKWATMPLVPHAIGVAIKKSEPAGASVEDGEANLKNIRSRRRKR